MHGSRSHYDYTVAWISVLPLEMAAATRMFNQFHDRLPQPLTDTNTDTLGSICSHNVVLVCLPSGVYGTISAATVVAQMLSTFPRLQYGLLVGIGGGAPSENDDIRLGNVVVSKRTRTYGGVVQYVYGKTLAGRRFEQSLIFPVFDNMGFFASLLFGFTWESRDQDIPGSKCRQQLILLCLSGHC
ncbi:hypothetical protein IFM5058_08347 [Aspergillus udagawae]|nr:hypothetical protein IFM5058_08347 [Aspergillus udagawae]